MDEEATIIEEHQELSDQKTEFDFELLHAVINYQLKGFYPEGLLV